MCLKVILRLARHLYLEKEIITANNEMLKANKISKKLLVESMEHDIVDFGNLSNFIDDQIGLKDFLYSDLTKFSYSRINYKKAEWEQFDGVGSNEEFKKYLFDKKINYDHLKFNSIVKQCGEYENEQVSFYQVKDQTLGEFLMSIYKERNSGCNKCQRPMFNHYTLYVRSKSYVKLSTVQRIDPHLAILAKDSASSQSNTSHQNQQFPGSLINKDLEKKQQQITTFQDYSILPESSNKRKKTTQKEKVLSYILCEQCHQNLTIVQDFYIGSIQEQYSYNRFIQHMFQEHCESYKQENQQKLKEFKENPKEVNSFSCLPEKVLSSNNTHNQAQNVPAKCCHTSRSRVFKFKEVEIKFQCGRNTLFSFSRVSFASDTIQNAIKEKDQEYYKEEFLNLKGLFKSLFLHANIYFINLQEMSTKKQNKMQYLQQVQEIYKSWLERMECERDYAVQLISQSKIINYKSLIMLYILEQRINIGISRLNSQQKELAAKKFKQIEKGYLEDTTHSEQMDASIIEFDFQEFDSAKNYKDYQPTLNVQEEKHLESDHTQPFEYMPIYQKNYISMIAWSLNTKHYSRYLKENGLGNPKATRILLVEVLKKKLTDEAQDEKTVIDENKLIIKVIKCHEIEILGKFESYFNADILQNFEIQKASFIDQERLKSESEFSQAIHQIQIGLQQKQEDQTQSETSTTGPEALQKTPRDHSIPQVRVSTEPSLHDLALKNHQMKIKKQQSEMNSSTQKHHFSFVEQRHLSQNQQGDKFIPLQKQPAEKTPKDNVEKSISKKKYVSSNHLDKLSIGNSNNEANNLSNTSNKQSSANNLDFPDKNSQNKNEKDSNPQPTSPKPMRKEHSQKKNSSPDQIPPRQPHNLNVIPHLIERNLSEFTSQQHRSQSPQNTGINVLSIIPDNSHSNASIFVPSQFSQNNHHKTNHMSLVAQSTTSSFQMSPQDINGEYLVHKGGAMNEKISEIVIYFAKQFEALRNIFGISLERIIQSLRTCAVIHFSGGQTQSVFVKSHDELFIVKKIELLEFDYFLGYAPQYFEYMAGATNTLIAKTFGVFEIRFEGEKHYYSVMENLFYGIDIESTQSYDLKGSKKKRFLKTKGIGLDTNFLIDFNGEPFFIDNSTYQSFDKTVRNDSDFLANQQIVDYSLLLIVDKNKKLLRLGIIDYYRKFDLPKDIERRFKGLIYGEDPTIIEPRRYQERFVKTLTKKFFCKV